jgi:cytoskeletal protein CcmA (bactofilin family)
LPLDVTEIAGNFGQPGINMPSIESLTESKRLFIGEGVTIKGEVAVPDTLVVCGVLEGDVTANNLVVCESGVIKGKVSVGQNADIYGKVFDHLAVENLLVLRSTSIVDATVSYAKLEIERGATLAGAISSLGPGQEQKPAKIPSSSFLTNLSVVEPTPRPAA